jgi:hypothetical protein
MLSPLQVIRRSARRVVLDHIKKAPGPATTIRPWFYTSMPSSPSPSAFLNQLVEPKIKDATLPEDRVEANRQFCDVLAPTYDQQATAHGAFAKAITDATLKLYPFNKEETTMLDFACGTGI